VGADWRQDATRREKVALVDPTTPTAARVGDYLYGGPNNFEADRRTARALVAAAPAVEMIAPAARAFRQRVVRYLVARAGIRQFLDIGTNLVVAGNTHEVAQSLVPECRIVYVDNDPMVLVHARALMKSAPGGAIGYVDADVCDPATIVADARATLDFGQPAAIMLLATLGQVEDTAAAAAVVSSLTAAVPSGSYVAIYHVASDLNPRLPLAARQWNQMSAQPVTLRSRSEVASLVAGLRLVPPGLVPISEWHPAATDPRFEEVVPVHGVLARKP
jgi:S-adenosyl methyltransferase